MTTCAEREPNCNLEQTPERQDGQQPMRPRRASAVRAVASGQEHAERNGTGDDDEKDNNLPDVLSQRPHMPSAKEIPVVRPCLR